MKCSKCGRKLKSAASIAIGVGPVCAGKPGIGSRSSPSATPDRALSAAFDLNAWRVFFMSGPRATRHTRRSYVVRHRTDRTRSSEIVRVYPIADSDERDAICTCPLGRQSILCDHVRAIAPIDRAKFIDKDLKNEKEISSQ